MSTPWTEKAGKVVFNTPNYSWYQSIDDVVITIPVPPGTAARQIDYSIKTDRLRIGLKGQKPIIDGPLFGTVVPDECAWTIEDGKAICLVLQKGIKHQVWLSIVKNEHEIDLLTKDQMEKKMMLEKFQNEYAGFDFSGAEFTGQVPADPANFMKFD